MFEFCKSEALRISSSREGPRPSKCTPTGSNCNPIGAAPPARPDQRHPGAGGDTLSPPGGRACAPDQDAIAGPGQAQVQLVPGKLQDAPQTPVAQEAQVLMIKPPGHPAQCEGALRRAEAQLFRFAVSARPVAADVEPVIAPSVFCHCTKGASVT